MFDPKKPYNELPLLPPKADFNDVKLLKLVNKANNSLFELKGSAHVLPNRLILLSPLTIREAVASSGIENINTTVSEALKADALHNTQTIRGAEKETLYYRDALMYGFELLQKQGFLSVNSYIDMQAILEPTKKGVRKLPGTTIENQATKAVVYTPPEGHSIIQEKLKNFEEYFNATNDLEEVDPLVKLAVMHYQFEAIHPFLDGNGRTGRILMVLYLVMVSRLDLPILFLSKYILENRSDYYRLLNAVTSQGAWLEWVAYILKAIDEQARLTNTDILKIKNLMEKYKEMGRARSSHILSQPLHDYLFSNAFYTQKNLAEHLGVHRNTAAKYCAQLEQMGIVKKFKHKQGHVYYNQEFLDILSY